MPLLSQYARRKKYEWFLQPVPRDACILEIGSGDGWMARNARAQGFTRYQTLDLHPPADVVGDILAWRTLGLSPAQYDVILAFEVVEHVDCFQACYDLLKPGGLLMLTSPVPAMDWACRCLERIGLSQRRTSPHDHLIDFRTIPLFEPVEIRILGGLAQWGRLRKPD